MSAKVYKAIQIMENIYWVGAVDWTLRNFHGYATDRGTTYNAYLITGDFPTLIDTVKYPFKDEMLSRIASVINPSDIQYIVSNHAEMDHSGCLPAAIDIIKPEKVFASAKGKEALREHFGLEDVEAVKTGDSIEVGPYHLDFVESAMLHWPDSMITVVREKNLVFSQDAFGMHLATDKMYVDEHECSVIDWETKKYYANILMPYAPMILRFIEKIQSSGMQIDMIAPDHGPIWRSEVHIGNIVDAYVKWSKKVTEKKAVIVYDTMWQSTEKMGRAIAEGLVRHGVTVRLMSLASSSRSDIATEVLDAAALFVGSPTINNNMFPTLADAMTYLKGLKPKGLIGQAFGSFGWSGESVKQLRAILDEMKVTPIGEPINSKYVPTDDVLLKCVELGEAAAGEIMKD